jgi:hypothetical protein
MRLNFISSPAVPESLPVELGDVLRELSKKKTKREVLDASYELLTEKYRGHRIKTLTNLFDLFDVDVAKLWSKHGFLHCTNMNYLLKILLVGSKKFNESDVSFHWTTINYYSPHEYLRVRLDDATVINVDIWGKAYGIQFGDYAHGFHSGSLWSKDK